jgi:hypothetical protein
MPFTGSAFDPSADPAARKVLIAFRYAQTEGLPIADCYKRAVEAWVKAHPDQAFRYASCKAVELIVRARRYALMQVGE